MEYKLELKHDLARDSATGGRKGYTFTIDGAPSGYWCPTAAAALRVIGRLGAGRSGEAFGGAGVVTPGASTVRTPGHDRPPRGRVVRAGEVTTETVTLKSGRVKAREKRPGYLYELDGKACEGKVVTSEAQARGLCAVHAFATRGRLGRFAEAEAAFRDAYGKDCKVQVLDLPGSALHQKIVAKDADGGLWHVGMRPDGGVIKFTLVMPPPPG